MLEGLKISLCKLKMALNIFACTLLILLLMVPFANAISTKVGIAKRLRTIRVL
jgi:hypothetical protein